MLRTFRILLLLYVAGFSKFADAAEAVDLLLILASDVSRSVDHKKFELQRAGYASAIVDNQVIKAITGGPNRRIAVSFVEWSGVEAQRLVIDWTMIDDAVAARKFGNQLLELPRSFAGRTSISGGIDYAITVFSSAPYQSGRRTIDVSGDGTNNSGRAVNLARDDAVAAGITINGLVILSNSPLNWNPEHTHPPGGLANYYRTNVIGGPSSFVMVAENFDSFSQAIRKKLIAEIADVTSLSGTDRAIEETRRRARVTSLETGTF